MSTQTRQQRHRYTMNNTDTIEPRPAWSRTITSIALVLAGAFLAVGDAASQECDPFCRVMNARLQLWGSDAGSALICDERELAKDLEVAALDYFRRQLDPSDLPAVKQRFGELVENEWQFQHGKKPDDRYCKVVVTAAQSSLRHIAELSRRGE